MKRILLKIALTMKDKQQGINMLKIIADVTPMGAVRMTQRGKWVKDNAQRYLAYKESIGLIARSTVKGEPLKSALGVNIRFYYPIPKSFSKKKRQEALDGDLRPAVKPDIDNCVKGVFDALNKIVWHDDNQVVSVKSEKWYAEAGRVEIEVTELF